MKADGITLIIRGQKNDDALKPPVRTGTVINGVEFLNPIEHMTTDEVFAYLRDNNVEIPAAYSEGATSAPDCMHCTAWLEHKGTKYVTTHHPEVGKEVKRRLWIIKQAVTPYLNELGDA
jgi:3'-phosphoadenosine 5'-phosphosulfate sulfotransferase (PAPS reductase)/FAD synthetase